MKKSREKRWIQGDYDPAQMLTVLSSSYRPDGRKKAFVRLSKDVDALDVANKVSPSSAASLASSGPNVRATDRLHLKRLLGWAGREWGRCMDGEGRRCSSQYDPRILVHWVRGWVGSARGVSRDRWVGASGVGTSPANEVTSTRFESHCLKACHSVATAGRVYGLESSCPASASLN